MHLKQLWSKESVFVRTMKLPVIYMVAFLAFFETLFHMLRMGDNGENLALKLHFAIFYGVILGTIITIIPEKVAGVTTVILTAVITVYYIAQLIYSGVFNTYLSISGTFHVATQALDFTDVIANELRREWWKLLIMLFPVVWLSVLGRRWMDFSKKSLYHYMVFGAAAVVTFLSAYGIMYKEKNEIYSAYNVYRHYSSVDMSTQKLGVVQTLVLDTVSGIKAAMGKEEEVSFVNEQSAQEIADDMEDMSIEELAVKRVGENMTAILALGEKVMLETKGVDTSPNVLDIDFEKLIEEETNSNIASLHTYISGLTPTDKNEYTGMFEGYNVIFVVAEGFSGYVVDKNRTPTLYSMIHDGFYFKNYYTPLWYGSTLGGEYADLTGLMPKNGGYLSMQKAGANKNDMCFTLSKQLERLGYTVTGYHANDYTYYDRQISHPNLGLNWIGVGNGYEPEYSESGVQLWPQSDLRLVQNTFDDYKKAEPFYTYYLTVSGHVMYNFGGNAMSARHKDLVEDLEYSETTKAYIACQYELEFAMQELVERLEDAGIADRTLIVLTADHVPYNDKPILDELAGRTLDQTFEWYKNSLIIWSASMDECVTVNKYCSSLDILPTVSNLMGLEYDSRMLVGQDILSDSEGIVMFNDRSFITDKCSYNANTGQVLSIDGSAIDDEYVENIKAYVSNKFNMAQSICDYDYYRYIDPWKQEPQ